MTRKYSWAVLLCHNSDDVSGFVSIDRQKVVEMFTAPDMESVVKFWNDISFGKVDLSGSRAYGWIALRQTQSDYTGSGQNAQGRDDLVEWAKGAARDAGVPLDSFDGVVVYMSILTAPPVDCTKFDLWGIDNK